MSKKKKTDTDDDIKIYPNAVGISANGTLSNRTLGSFGTLAVTDTTNRFPKTNIAKPSDHNVEESRDWVMENKI